MARADSNAPGVELDDGATRLSRVAFADAAGAFDLTIRDGRVVEIQRAPGDAEWLCLPPLADLHVHANRAFTLPPARPQNLEDAARMAGEVFGSFRESDYHRQAARLIDAARRRGTSRLRTHADIGADAGLDAVHGSLRAAEDCRETVDVEVVAFASATADPASADGRALLRDAISSGAQLLGAAPAFCADQDRTIDALLDLAIELAVPVDVHLDEHLVPSACRSEYLAAATIDRGLQGRVTIGHGCAIGILPDADRKRTIDRLAQAGITVIALPRTNLYLQDSGSASPTRRGVAPAKDLLRAGIDVRFASDNVQDAFYPYGDADLLGVAMDAVLATHVDDPREIVAAVCDGRVAPKPGEVADMVVLRGRDVDTVLADPPAERWVYRFGVPVAVA